ncbi:hypothetical protein [Shinella zoogloeoides]|uniref:hypothetical protein n=1 Tax=Shinella zoogloeoides TaxID=352475 RepID=UPI00299F3376|nr:hypothetical protein [Shinella zoogloeoides]WPE19907.1 hypothetical protein ShzoTeo12_10830 [Shinella zoogloeoides]
MKLSEFLDGIRDATTVEELQAAITADFKHSYRGPTWTKICKARIEAGYRLVDAHEHGRFVPRFGAGRKLQVCGETCGVGRGYNSTGVRYVWHAAGEWAMSLMRKNGLSIRASHRVWDQWRDYPHCCLAVIEKSLAGEIPDPKMDTLIGPYKGHSPINYGIERNEADEWDKRASRPCPCGNGTLFDWGGGWSEGFDFVNWHCNGCPDVYTEYMSRERFYAMRQSRQYVAVEVA